MIHSVYTHVIVMYNFGKKICICICTTATTTITTRTMLR